VNRIKYLLITLALILGVGLFITSSQAQSGTAPIKYNSKKDTLYTPKTDTIKNVLTLTGSVSSDQIANLRFQNSGKLTWVGVKIGDQVKRGQTIASLDREQLRKNLQTQFNNYLTQLSSFQDIQSQYQSTRDNYLVTDTVQRILDRTQYSLDNSVINYEIADMAIKESVITSPINGVVIALDQPLAGVNITPTTANFTIVNPNSIFFKAEIDQEYVNNVNIGQKASLSLDSFPDISQESKIIYIAFTPVAGQTSTVYEIRFELPLKNDDLSYRLGMDGDADIILSQAENALIVPIDAVYEDNNQKYVYLLSGKELIRRDVVVGIENDTESQILEGLSANDQIAIIKQ